MIVGIFHQGSGLGNQLHRYVATRVRAADLGVDWAMLYNPDGSGKEVGFKGSGFIDIPSNKILIQVSLPSMWHEKKVVENGVDVRSYDPEFNFIKDNTIIDGEFQDERYFAHRMSEVDKWLAVEPLNLPENLCVIGFRGGEFSLYPDLFLTKEYWDEGIRMMKDLNPSMEFEVHTDDPLLAKQFFPDYPCIHNIGLNWRSVRYAKQAIIANSSFYILPRLLNGGFTIAPRYWGRRNTKVWCLPQNFYRDFTHI